MKMPFVSIAAATSSLLGGLLVLGIMGANPAPANDAAVVLFQARETTADVSQPNIGASSGGAEVPPGGTSGAAPATAPSSGMIWSEKIVRSKPDSQIATDALDAMQNDVDLEGLVTVQDLTSRLTQTIGIPVWLDERAIEFAKLDPATQSVQFDAAQESLTTSLHRALNPLGLKAVVQNEGVVITADRVALGRKGIGASKWLNIDEDAARKIDAALEQTTTVKFVEEMLSNSLANLGERHGISILVDARALEEIGLNSDTPVTFSMSDVKLRTVLVSMLADLALTLTVDGEILKVTTTEAAEARRLTRIYLLSGVGFPKGNTTHAIDTIQTTISPDTWEALGGPSTMREMLDGEEASLIVSTTYQIHSEIEMLLSRLRDTNFGDDPVIERIQVPIPSGGMGSGGMF